MSVDHSATRPRPLRELVFVAALFLAYKLGRLALTGDLPTAYTNAAHLWDLERAWGLPSEAGLQRTLLDHGWAIRAANVYYAGVHFPATAALLLWTFLRRPARYRWARTTIATLTAAALVLHVLLPLAPPRLLPLAGMVDTGHAMGPSVYGTPGTDALTNQYAAMPSLHVGWAAAVAIVLITASRSRWRWLWLLHPLLTLAVVVVTANHYWLDAAVALVLLGLILLVPTLLPRPVPAQAPDPVRAAPDLVQVAPGSVQVAPGSVRVAPGSVQVAPGLVRAASDLVQVAPGSVPAAPDPVQAAPGSVRAAADPVPLLDAGVWSGRRPCESRGSR